MLARVWKELVLTASLITLATVHLRLVEAQGVNINECRLSSFECDPNAYCEDTEAAYICVCRCGWSGDGLVGPENSGCQKNPVAEWQLLLILGGSVFGATALVYSCCALIRKCVITKESQNNVGHCEDSGSSVTNSCAAGHTKVAAWTSADAV